MPCLRSPLKHFVDVQYFVVAVVYVVSTASFLLQPFLIELFRPQDGKPLKKLNFNYRQLHSYKIDHVIMK